MLPLRPGRTGLSAPSGSGEARTLDDLRRTIARMQAPAVALDAPGDIPLGVADVDRALGGGLARGALHEIAACGEAHIAAATGFALGLAAASLYLPLEGGGRPPKRSDGGREGMNLEVPSHPTPLASLATLPLQGRVKQAVVWVAEDMALLESGAPYGPGLDLFGLKPERLLTVAGAKAGDVLWAMEEALRCRAVGAVLGEVRSPSRALDLVATRRLSLAAAAHGATALLLRTEPGAEASTAATRWVVEAASSLRSSCPRLSRASTSSFGGGGKGVDGRDKPGHDAVGPPRFALALMRNRRGPLGTWMLEWSVSDVSFVLATHPESVVKTAIDRSDRAYAA